jgi:hypothetical protein
MDNDLFLVVQNAPWNCRRNENAPCISIVFRFPNQRNEPSYNQQHVGGKHMHGPESQIQEPASRTKEKVYACISCISWSVSKLRAFEFYFEKARQMKDFESEMHVGLPQFLHMFFGHPLKRYSMLSVDAV